MHNKSVFIKRLVKPTLPSEKCRTHTGKPADKCHSFDPEGGNIDNVDFPPAPLDKNLSNVIIGQACSRMNAHSISKTGCAVCGELKPVCHTSRLKSVKQQLHILAVPGITHVERKSSSVPL